MCALQDKVVVLCSCSCFMDLDGHGHKLSLYVMLYNVTIVQNPRIVKLTLNTHIVLVHIHIECVPMHINAQTSLTFVGLRLIMFMKRFFFSDQ